MQKGHCTEGCAEEVYRGVRGRSVWMGYMERCAEGLSAKRSLCRGVQGGGGHRGVWRSVQRL